MVGLEGLLQHTCVEVVPNFKLACRQRSDFGHLLGSQVNRLRCTVIKSKAHCLSVLLKDLAAGSYLGVLEHLGRLSNLVLVNLHLLLKSGLLLGSLLLIELLLPLEFLLGDRHT